MEKQERRREQNKMAARRSRHKHRVLFHKIAQEAEMWRRNYNAMLAAHDYAVHVRIPELEAEVKRLRQLCGAVQ